MNQPREEKQKYVVVVTSAVVRRELTAEEKKELLDDYLTSDLEILFSQTEFSPNNIMTTTSTLSNGTRVTYRQYSPESRNSKFVVVGYEIIESRHHSTIKTADPDEIESAERLPESPEPTEYDKDLTTVSHKQLVGNVQERNKFFRALKNVEVLANEATAQEEPGFKKYQEILGVLANAGIIKKKKGEVS